MTTVTRTHGPPLPWGMTSLVLGTLGLVLAIFPVLGIPLSAFGVLFGLIGLCAAWSRRGAMLRWSLMGIALSGAALGANVAITYAPAGYLSSWDVQPSWQPIPDRPRVSPPAP